MKKTAYSVYEAHMNKLYKCRKHKCYKRYNGDSEWICPKCEKKL